MVNTNYPKIVMVSGCFDPLHLGHLKYFKAAKLLGDLLVVVIDGDEYTISKKGKVFLPTEDRKAIIEELRCVDRVIVNDQRDIGNIILKIKPYIWALGDDYNQNSNIPVGEKDACLKVNCKIVYGVSGKKIRSSSELLRRWTS